MMVFKHVSMASFWVSSGSIPIKSRYIQTTHLPITSIPTLWPPVVVLRLAVAVPLASGKKRWDHFVAGCVALILLDKVDPYQS